MSMLNPDQFSQAELPGMPPRTSAPASPLARTDEPPRGSSLDDYGGHDGAHFEDRWENGFPPAEDEHGNFTPSNNPIFSETAFAELYDDPDHASRGAKHEEFIPTRRTVSPQAHVNPDAIAHQVANADPMRLGFDPDVEPFNKDGVEHYFVNDGNHRVNAALQRGQLFMPADVTRPEINPSGFR